MKGISILQAKHIKSVELRNGCLTLEEFIAISKYHAKLIFHPDFIFTVQKSRSLVDQFLEENRAVYGVTTGFGDNVKYAISKEDTATLQINILRSHACSVGTPLSETEVRGIMLMIILNSGKGYSGIKPETLNLLKDMLNLNVYPFAPGSGSVGYLSVEAHIALTLIGEGFIFMDGTKISADTALKHYNLTPLRLGSKEGLILITGTTSATAYGLLAVYETLIAMKNAEINGALIYEALHATAKALDERLHSLKKHEMQQKAAANLTSLLSGSQICQHYKDTKVQDACALRTMPQIHGAVKQLIQETYDTVLAEMHSVSDNPVLLVVDEGEGQALMTGNFDGTFLATHCDMLTIACANLGGLIERLTDRLINHHINEGLPAFLVKNPGLNNGFMIPQYTQAALLAEIKLLASPASIDSITTCAGWEDPVSMAYRASQKSYEAALKLEHMTAIELMTALQAIDLRNENFAQAPVLKKIHDYVRKSIPVLDQDRYLYGDMERIHEIIVEMDLIEIAEKELDVIL
jgi:histidine ammonia-lyase